MGVVGSSYRRGRHSWDVVLAFRLAVVHHLPAQLTLQTVRSLLRLFAKRILRVALLLPHFFIMCETRCVAQTAKQSPHANVCIPSLFVDSAWIHVFGFESLDQQTEFFIRRVARIRERLCNLLDSEGHTSGARRGFKTKSMFDRGHRKGCSMARRTYNVLR